MITKFLQYFRHIRSQLDITNRKLDELANKLDQQRKMQDEILFANLFRDSIQDSDWVKDKSFSPFQSAANYSLLYKLYKIYDVFQPKNTLELGLGQTTKLTTQYLKAHTAARALVADDDNVWIDIYNNQFEIPKNLTIQKFGLQDFKYGGKTLQKMGEYKGLLQAVKHQKYNLIIVDGPIGWNKKYSRTNVIHMINNIAEDWVVVFDDAERPGEQRTIDIFREELAKAGIKYAEFVVDGLKSQHYFCASQLYITVFNI